MSKPVKSSTVLVVVDMQAGFKGAQDAELVERIERVARRTVAAGGHVLRINFDGNGIDTVALPSDTATVWKGENDGGAIVYAYLLGAGLVKRDVRVVVCGVNLCACVFATASGLAARLFDERGFTDSVSVAVHLCGDESRFRVRFDTATS